VRRGRSRSSSSSPTAARIARSSSRWSAPGSRPCQRTWINLQRAYFALQASGDLARLDGKLFQALHEEHLPLFEEPALAEWVGKNGGDAQKFAAAYTSFGINNLTVEADKMSEDYQVTGIPTMAVAGKYIALGDTFTALLASTDKLIAKARAEAKAAHPKK
jgi:thiol:disulfide interchange protein DsbA